MRVVVVAAIKGGVGKSTLALHLACGLAGRRRVVLVDADRQRTVADWCERGDVPVPCHALELEDERHAASWVARIRALDAEVVVIDTAPHATGATRTALVIADLVVIPVEASGASIVATGATIDLLREVRELRADRGRPRAVVIPSRIDRRWAAAQDIGAALAPFGEPVGPAIYHRAAFATASTAGRSVLDMAPHSRAAEDVRALVKAARRYGEGL